jgi:hypothetical protein
MSNENMIKEKESPIFVNSQRSIFVTRRNCSKDLYSLIWEKKGTNYIRALNQKSAELIIIIFLKENLRYFSGIANYKSIFLENSQYS